MIAKQNVTMDDAIRIRASCFLIGYYLSNEVEMIQAGYFDERKHGNYDHNDPQNRFERFRNCDYSQDS